MYLDHFGIAQYPFSLTPNTRFFLTLPSHQQAFDALVKVLQSNGHLARITGEVGTGKTMLCRKVLNALDLYPDRFVTAFIPHPVQSEDGIMHAIGDEIGAGHSGRKSYYELLRSVTVRLKELAQQRKRIVLFIDEAQAMPEETLKAVYLLTQVSLEKDRHLQLVLFGQPELEQLFQHPALRPLQDSLDCSYELQALDREGTAAYVGHRINRAGYNGPSLFDSKALDLLYAGSQGIPRLINILCHKAMMVAYGKGDHHIAAPYIESAIVDTESSFGHAARRRRHSTD